MPEPDTDKIHDSEEVPRYRVLLQDGNTGVQLAAGTDNLDDFAHTDLMKMVEHFKKNVREFEADPVKAEMTRRAQNGSQGA